jgi:hypothetical protein
VEQELAQALTRERRLAELIQQRQQPREHGIEALAAYDERRMRVGQRNRLG